MSSFQKTIKYIAIAFAVFLAVAIISGIGNAVFAIVSAITGGLDSGSRGNDTTDFQQNFTEVRSLDIENSTGKLIIKSGETFRVEAENVSTDFTAKMKSNGTLYVSDENKNFEFLWFHINGFNSPNSKITVYLPDNFVADEAKISTGAGTVSVEGLHADYLYISAGAGNISGSNITAEEAKIEGGVGTISLDGVNMSDGDFDCGVGELNIEGILAGKTKIDCGVGDVDLDLQGYLEDYELEIDSGIGTVRLNGEKISGEYKSSNNAPNSINVDGGVGDVKINIQE